MEIDFSKLVFFIFTVAVVAIHAQHGEDFNSIQPTPSLNHANVSRFQSRMRSKGLQFSPIPNASMINRNNSRFSVRPSRSASPKPSNSSVRPPTTIQPRIPIIGYKFHCDFEKDSCGATMDRQWRRHSGRTPSDFTGPSGDASPGNSSKFYTYYEASSPELSGNKRKLTFKFMGRFLSLFGSRPGCLRFSYHMYGVDMGRLRVYTVQNSTKTLIFHMQGNKGDRWFQSQVNLRVVPEPQASGITLFDVVFEAERGSDFTSDIAIDEISLLFRCTANTTPSPNITTTTAKPINTTTTPGGNTTTTPGNATTTTKPQTTYFKCDYEKGLCGPVVNTYNHWERRNQYSQYSTGPYIDNTKGDRSGYYMHIRRIYYSSGYKYLEYRISNGPSQTSTYCLSFAYHMFGSGIRSFRAGYRTSSGTLNLLLSEYGNKGDIWRQATLSFKINGVFNLVFEVYDSSYSSYDDVAIDDIHLTDFCMAETTPGTSTAFLPYGRGNGDSSLSYGTYSYYCLNLPRNFPLFSFEQPTSRLCVHSNGHISTNTYTGNRYSFPQSFASFVPYHQYFRSNGRNMHYRLTYDKNQLAQIDRDVALVLGKQKGTPNTFQAKAAVVVTFDNVQYYDYSSSTAKFQSIIVTDYKYTFGILNYMHLSENAKFAGFSNPTCKYQKMFTNPSLTSGLQNTSNIGKPGKHIYLLTNKECINGDVMYPYGTEHNDVTRSSSYSFRQYIGKFKGDWAIFSRPYKPSLYISTDGYISTQSYSYLPTTSAIYIAPYYYRSYPYRTQSSIYYRETTNASILQRADTDIKTSFNTTINFKSKHAFIATFTRSDGYRYQVVLATNGTETYGIMNYGQLTNDAYHVGMNEIGCGQRSFVPPYKSSKALINGSTNGIRGRHVFLLTKRGCFKYVSGVRNSVASQSTRSVFNNVYRNFPVLKLNEISNVLMYVSEAMTRSNDFVTIMPVMYRGANNPNSYVISGVTFTPKRQNYYVSFYWQNSFVLEGTATTADFQYGVHNETTLSASEFCENIYFEEEMASIPTVKVTAILQQSDVSQTLHIWLKKVTRTYFILCGKEMITFTGPKKFDVNYIAATNSTKTISETNSVYFPTVKSFSCLRKKLNKIYIGNPNVFSTPEEVISGSTEPVVSWIKYTTESHVEVCVKSQRVEPFKVHLIVNGEISPCTNFHCPDHLQCRLENKTTPYCGCIKSCFGMEGRGEFCGSDYINHKSICSLNQNHCYKYGNNTKTNITVSHYGRCQFKPLQSGRTQLAAVPEMNGVFCKYITIDSKRFLPASTTPLKVLLTVSWNKQSFSVPSDASASWSEDISVNGFKACALVSGRHKASDFANPPVIHWTVFQENVFEGRVRAGVAKLKTWYTGTQCQIIQTNFYAYNFLNNPKVIASIHHTAPKNYQNAMTVWTELQRSRYSRNYAIKVCARELQNFDGIHEGIEVHWILAYSYAKTFPPYIPEQIDINFPKKTITMGQSNPAECKTITYNLKFPSLENPTVIVGGISIPDYSHPTVSPSTKATLFSRNDFAVWLEETSQARVTVCMKSLYTSDTSHAVRPAITINMFTIPQLCENKDSIYFDGSCYTELPKCESNHLAHAKCLIDGSHLPIINNRKEQIFFQERIESHTWIGLRRSPPDTGKWAWDDGSSLNYTNWFSNQPANVSGHNCAVMDERKIEIGWDEEHCSACRKTYCEKDPQFGERSCKQLCLHGGKCLYDKMMKSNNSSNNISCQCLDGFYGARCEIDVNDIEGCKNYTAHDETWRHYKNQTSSMQSNTTSCDAKYLNDGGWHRFIGAGGDNIHSGSCIDTKRCGTKSPGWMAKNDLPTIPATMTNATLHFHSFYCADDLGSVSIQNCGKFNTYKFTRFPYWSCDYGICTS